MRIVLIGKNGQLGRDCMRVFGRNHELLAFGSNELDITDGVQVEDMVRGLHPEAILNCAAFSKVDVCEYERELAYRINVTAVRHLATSLARHGGKLLHISTDYVFDGCKPVPEPYLEEDPLAALSYYGQTKVEAELVVRQELQDFIIVRTAWLYGRHGHNFLKTMLRLTLSDPVPQIKVVNDQFGSPTWSYRLAEQLVKIIEIDGQGIYHATAEGYATWFEVACSFLTGMGIDHKIEPCTTADYPTPARRPKNSILENHHLKTQNINLMRSWQNDLEEFILTNRDFLIQEAKNPTAGKKNLG
jgi:dTDP-4-dehydrorhamnose reductase